MSIQWTKKSRSIAGKIFSNFEMLDARIAAALSKIIQNSYFKKKVSLEDGDGGQEKVSQLDRKRGQITAISLLKENCGTRGNTRFTQVFRKEVMRNTSKGKEKE